MRIRPLLLTLTSTLFLCTSVYAGESGDTTRLPAGYLNQVGSKAQSVDDALTQKSTQYLNKLSKLEARLLGKLHKADTTAGAHLPTAQYQQFAARLQNPTAGGPVTYVPGLDTLQTTLKFLQTQPGSSPQLAQASAQVQQLQANLNQSTLIQQYISQRKQEISQLLSQYTHLPPGVTQAFANYKAEGYYYSQQIESFKATLNDPQKMEQTAIAVLSKLPAYQQFLSKYSLLASLFQMPSGYGSGTATTQGLQTQAQVQQLLQSQIGGGGAQVGQQLQAAQGQMTGIQNAVSKYGAGGQDVDMPNFSPNSQKTKSLLQRLSYGVNIQFAQSSYDFPTTGDLGLSLGYKINDKSTIGVGASYNIGLGTGWSNMQFSSQGVGLRSFMDWKIRKTYYIVGGYELNYMTAFSSIADLRNRSAWEPSALFGLEKKYKISSKLQGNLQILFDALYKQEIPQGQMIKFRVGYNF